MICISFEMNREYFGKNSKLVKIFHFIYLFAYKLMWTNFHLSIRNFFLNLIFR